MASTQTGIMLDALHAGGVEKIALNQTRALRKINPNTTLVVLRRTKLTDYPFQPLLDEIPVVFLDDRLPAFLKLSFKIPFFSFFSWYHFSYPLLLPWVVKKDEFKALVSHGTYTTLTALSLRLTKNIPYFFMLWDPIGYILKKAYPKGPIQKAQFILLPLAKIVDLLLVRFSKQTLTAGLAHLGYFKSLGQRKISLLYPGVEVNSKLIKEKKNYLITVTAWKAGKNQEFLIKILQTIPDIKIIMAGSWYPKKLRTAFKSETETRGLKDRLQITGPVSEKELRKLYSQARLFLQVSDDRGFGLPALEAASCACPFIIPKNQGVGELFENGVDGFFVDINNTDEVIGKIRRLLKDQNLALTMGERVWEKVRRNYSWEQHGLKLNELINKVEPSF